MQEHGYFTLEINEQTLIPFRIKKCSLRTVWAALEQTKFVKI